MSDAPSALKVQLLSGNRKYSIAQAKEYVASILAAHDIDTNERFHNRFFHEFWPLLNIAQHTGDAETTIDFTAVENGLDGRLLFGHNQRSQAVELTAAIDGETEALRMELLKIRGNAPGIGPIEAQGTKNSRAFGPNENWGGLATEHDQAVLLLMQNALALKQKKAAKRPQYRDAWLGIVIHNYPPGADLKKKRYDPVCRALLSDPESYAPFSRVFCICVCGEYLFDSNSLKLPS